MSSGDNDNNNNDGTLCMEIHMNEYAVKACVLKRKIRFSDDVVVVDVAVV